MEISLRGKVALVTGASRGIGKEIAKALAKAGADVILCGRAMVLLENLKKEINGQSGGRALEAGIDVTSSFKVGEFFRYYQWRDPLDILVNNAGGAEKFGGFADLDDKDWRDAWELNFMSAVYMCRGAIPMLCKSSAPRIINIASVPAHQPGLFNPHYSAAKAALLNLSKHLANVLAKDGILVNAICPSTLKGGGWERNARDKASRLGVSFEEAEVLMEREESAKTPLGRVGVPGDVASLAVYLASEHASFITGHCFNVDGGITRAV